MASLQVCQWRVHAVVETIQDESSSGEGAFETTGAGAAVGSGGRDSNQKIAGGLQTGGWPGLPASYPNGIGPDALRRLIPTCPVRALIRT